MQRILFIRTVNTDFLLVEQSHRRKNRAGEEVLVGLKGLAQHSTQQVGRLSQQGLASFLRCQLLVQQIINVSMPFLIALLLHCCQIKDFISSFFFSLISKGWVVGWVIGRDPSPSPQTTEQYSYQFPKTGQFQHAKWGSWERAQRRRWRTVAIIQKG